MSIDNVDGESKQLTEGVFPDIQEHPESRSLRERNPDLWKYARDQEVYKDNMAYAFAKRVRDAGLSSDEVREFLLEKAPQSNYVDLTGEDIKPEAYQTVGSLCILPNRRVSTLRFGLDNARPITEADTRNTPPRKVFEIPYPSFGKPVKPSEKMDGFQITNLTTLKMTEAQVATLKQAIQSVPTPK